MKLSHLITPFLDDPANHYSPATKTGYRDRLRTLIDTIGDKDISAVTEQDLVDGITAGNVSQGYQKTRMATYRSFMSWASWKGHVETNPAEHLRRNVKLAPRGVKTHTWLTQGEVQAFLSRLPTGTPVERRNRVMFQLGFSTGLRRAELAALTWGQLNLTRQSARITGKGGKVATVYLSPGTLSVLGDWKAEAIDDIGAEPLTQYVLPRIKQVSNFDGTEPFYTKLWDRGLSLAWISNTVRSVSESIGQPITTHDMRRSYAGMVKDELGDIVKVQEALRHSNVGTTQRYLETRQDAAMLAGREANLGF